MTVGVEVKIMHRELPQYSRELSVNVNIKITIASKKEIFRFPGHNEKTPPWRAVDNNTDNTKDNLHRIKSR